MNTSFSVILGFIPRIHAKHSFVDTRDTPEYDKGLRLSTSILKHIANVILGFIPRIHAKVDTLVTPEYDNRKNFTKGLDVVRQCAAFLERLKTYIKIHPLFCHPRAWLLARPEDLDSRVKPENDYKVMQCGRSMIEMLGVLAIIGVLSVGGIAGYSKAMMKFKINKTMSQIAEIATNVRTLYAQQKDFNGLNNETAVQMGIVPDSLTTSVGRYYTTISNVFGGHVGIYKNLWRDERSFSVSFSGLPKEACIELATQNWGNATSSGIIGISVPDFSAGYDRLYIGCIGYEELYGVYAACSDSLPIPPSIAATYCQNEENSIILYYQ